MKVILLKDVKGHGKANDVVNVSDGFAKNYLFKLNLAIKATDESIRSLKNKQMRLEENHKQEQQAAENLAKELKEISLTIEAKAGEGQKLFGAVTSKEIAEALKEKGFTIDRKKIALTEPIKQLGERLVPIKIHPKVQAEVLVNVIEG